MKLVMKLRIMVAARRMVLMASWATWKHPQAMQFLIQKGFAAASG